LDSKEISETREGVHSGDNNGKNVTQIAASGVNVFKILTFGHIREQRNLTFDQLGTVRNFKKRVKLKLASFGKPNEKESVL